MTENFHGSNATSSKWCSYDIRLTAGLDEFLAYDLDTFASYEIARRRLKRYFYIRYGRGSDLHIRLRMLPTGDVDAFYYLESLSSLVRTYCVQGRGNAFSVTLSTYSRVDHYFGETLETVYAELLNERSSRVSSAILRIALGNKGYAACLVACVIRASIEALSIKQAALLLYQNIELSETNWKRSAGCEPTLTERAVVQAAAFIHEVWDESGRGFTRDRAVVELRKMVDRALPTGRRVIVHGFHLLANKIGLSCAAECLMLHGLSQMNGEISQ